MLASNASSSGSAGAPAESAPDSPQLLIESSDGTPAFRAPETYRPGRHCGRAADVWSLGVTLYAMLHGVLPFPFAAPTAEPATPAASSSSSSLLVPFALVETAVCEDPLRFPDAPAVSPPALQLLAAILCKEPARRASLGDITEHEWTTECEWTVGTSL